MEAQGTLEAHKLHTPGEVTAGRILNGSAPPCPPVLEADTAGGGLFSDTVIPAPVISPLPTLLLVTLVKIHWFTKLNTGAIVILSLVHPEQKRMFLGSVPCRSFCFIGHTH